MSRNLAGLGSCFCLGSKADQRRRAGEVVWAGGVRKDVFRSQFVGWGEALGMQLPSWRVEVREGTAEAVLW